MGQHALLEWHESEKLDSRYGFISAGKGFISPIALLAIAEGYEWVNPNHDTDRHRYAVRCSFSRSKNALESMTRATCELLAMDVPSFQSLCESQGVELGSAFDALGRTMSLIPVDSCHGPSLLYRLSLFRAFETHPSTPRVVVLNAAELAPSSSDAWYADDIERQPNSIAGVRQAIVSKSLSGLVNHAVTLDCITDVFAQSDASRDWALHAGMSRNCVGVRLLGNGDYDRLEYSGFFAGRPSLPIEFVEWQEELHATLTHCQSHPAQAERELYQWRRSPANKFGRSTFLRDL